MAQLDACISVVLWKYGILSLSIILLCFVLGVRNVNNVKQLWYVRFMELFSFHDEAIKTNAEAAFRTLHATKSFDYELRNKGLIRILMIFGRGANLAHMPKNCHLIVLEPNRHRMACFMSDLRKIPHVRLKRYLEGVSEKISVVDSRSIDIVVSTGVLCTVQNVQQTLNEIHRVLAPGGKLFFIEHVLNEDEMLPRVLQRTLDPLWALVFDGCHLNRDIGAALRETPFTSFYWFTVHDDADTIASPTLIGFAVK